MFKTDDDCAAIEHIIEQETIAWNKGDAEAFSRFMADDVSFTNILGMYFTGRRFFCDRHRQMMAGPFKRSHMSQQIISVKFVQSGVAIVNAFIRVSGCRAGSLPGVFISEEGLLLTRLLQVVVKGAVGWRVTAYQNVDIKAGVPIPEMQ